MNNAIHILTELDHNLTEQVDLTLYGKAALVLGFKDVPVEFGYSRDVDAVLWLGQAEEWDATGNFWTALERTNDELAGEGLYMTHLFEEDQVVLRPEWRQARLPINISFRFLQLHRLGNVDLLLSKLMRDDPIDHADAQFIVGSAGLSLTAVNTAIRSARVPDDIETREAFAAASARLCSWLSTRACG